MKCGFHQCFVLTAMWGPLMGVCRGQCYSVVKESDS